MSEFISALPTNVVELYSEHELQEIQHNLSELIDWQFEDNKIFKSWKLKNHNEVIDFVKELSTISQQTNHHPEVYFGFKDIKVSYWTHDVGKVTDKDFSCAKKVEALKNKRVSIEDSGHLGK
ncbi:MAG: 4a-hydroxytetrahydrobiopterin dehydratase [Lentisphaeraceae bacterium]|nr:4a-hydroxytetrahydrobiopterin dehydratase [Lentisphaeraceae bacterium]